MNLESEGILSTDTSIKVVGDVMLDVALYYLQRARKPEDLPDNLSFDRELSCVSTAAGHEY